MKSRSVFQRASRGLLGGLLAWLALAARAAEQPLGHNLAYTRIHTLPADLPIAGGTPRKGTLVLDLRFARADGNARDAFSTWLKSAARPQTPVIVLANPETSPALLEVLATTARPAGVVTVGRAASGANFDVTVHVSPEADRTAYDLFEKGTPLDQLVVTKVEKARHDEASYAKARAAGGGDGDAEETPARPADPAVAAEQNSAKASPPVDPILQRAVQLQHALLALRRIPAE
jgi:hypothetical protein